MQMCGQGWYWRIHDLDFVRADAFQNVSPNQNAIPRLNMNTTVAPASIAQPVLSGQEACGSKVIHKLKVRDLEVQTLVL